ncbi:hypothetical protein M9H77_33579 [Catharanthus roseus]|uniref:Uncharacterized protein n=1 Tax=Catharanthus roseus TaxID=4058 RepID=A0ACB9ZJP1_CATRO|nr:hypothetical protein M9H77_33579 [Catharanthus roseus]
MVRSSGRRGDDDFDPVTDRTCRVDGRTVTASSRGVRGRHSTSDLSATSTHLAPGFHHGTGEPESSTQPSAFIGQPRQIGAEFFYQIFDAAPQDCSCSTHGYSHVEYGVSSSVPYVSRSADRVCEGDIGFEGDRGLERSKKELDPYILRESDTDQDEGDDVGDEEQPVPVTPVADVSGSDGHPHHKKRKGMTSSFMSVMSKIAGSRNKRPEVAHKVPTPTQKRKKVKLSDWEQIGPTEEGPVDRELIPSYGGHDDLGLALTGGVGCNALELHVVATSRQTSLSPLVRAACYLQYILGSSLFSDKSCNIAPTRLWPLLQNASSIGRFAWGAACLAYLYRNMGWASRVDTKKLDGC